MIASRLDGPRLRKGLSPHLNPMESGPRNNFSAQNPNQTKRFMIFDPKNGVGSIFRHF